jgi:hypothetical protein
MILVLAGRLVLLLVLILLICGILLLRLGRGVLSGLLTSTILLILAGVDAGGVGTLGLVLRESGLILLGLIVALLRL